jgi:hypothetical protein
MTIDKAIMIAAFILSAVSLYFAIKRQSHDEDKVDADTIASLFQTVRDLECENRAIKKEFAEYKTQMNNQIADLANEIVRYRRWAKRLVSQLESAGITPSRLEDS